MNSNEKTPEEKRLQYALATTIFFTSVIMIAAVGIAMTGYFSPREQNVRCFNAFVYGQNKIVVDERRIAEVRALDDTKLHAIFQEARRICKYGEDTK